MSSRIAGCCAALALLVAAAPASATFRGKNGAITFSDGDDIARLSGGQVRDGTRLGGSEAAPSISRSGRALAFEYATPAARGEIYTSTLTGRRVRWVTKRASESGAWVSFHSPAWSRSGKRIVFVCRSSSRTELCTIGAKGRHLKRITRCNCAQDDSLPDWTRTDRIYFGTGTEIAWVRSGGGKVHTIYGDQHFAGQPSVSPNGKRVAFRAGPDAGTRVDMVNADGSDHHVLAASADYGNDPTDYDYPAWAPNGRSLLLHVSGLGPEFGGRAEGFYRVDPSGANLRPLVLLDAGDHPQPDWGPKPARKKRRQARS